MGKATLISYTKDAERVMASAYKISRTKGTASEVYESTLNDSDGNKKITGSVMKLGHTTPLEHAFFNINLDNVTAMVEQFLIEFRLASFTIKSRRYVDFRNAGYFGADAFNQDKKITELYINHMDSLFKKYEYFVDKGVAVEDARFVLPYSYYSNIVFSAGTRELRHIIYSMLYGRGSKYPELKDLGEQMLVQLKEISVPAFSNIEMNESHKDDKDEKLSAFLAHNNQLQNSIVTGNAQLVGYNPDSKYQIIRAAIISQGIYDEEYINEVFKDEELSKEIINVLLKTSRQRELEQAGFNFAVNNLSLAGLTHLTRHRMQSPVIPHISHAIIDNNFIVPPELNENDKMRNIYIDTFYNNKEVYDKYFKDKLEGVYFNLSGNTLSLQTYINYRELLSTIIPLRTCNRAQWEIRDIALDMLEQARQADPDIFNYSGPKCYTLGICPEKSLTCGHAREMKIKFKPSK
ncbi:MAG: FAD-dependent thymidylate synthase [Bacilli bacterium]|nr:FAD-dependent thymidylate synthase [Bacilli bacterium]MDD3305323.1 FAD-dependent thymidylate synthase [Bacilli bacterium]MDD4053556.1 FAD-dependent thymidylate synthase [Bacilli bacterium]MDD4411477.1 FAD-dependent thymidylate synthase [Bacilli bacterium]